MKQHYSIFKKLTVVAILLCTSMSIAQHTVVEDYKSKVTDQNANFFDIVAQKRSEFALKDLSIRENKKAFKQFERWAYIWQDRVNADGSFPLNPNTRLSKEGYIGKLMETQVENNRSATNPWTQIGPVDRPLENGYTGYPGKGRINVIAEDPNNTNTMYAGSAAGGVWKTIDNGVNWRPKSDFLAGLGVTDLLVDPTNSNIIYMATGDEDGEHISSIGVFKSIDAGESWNPTGLTFNLNENEYIRDISFAPGSSTKIFALTNKEIKVSIDSGSNWNNIPVSSPFDPFDELFQNIVFDPNNPMKVVVSDAFDAIYFSTDGGASFALHNTFQGGNNVKKLKLSSSDNDLDFFYGLTQDGVFRKYKFDLLNNNSDIVLSTTITGFNSQQGYNQCFAISPTNKNNVMVAGVNGYRSTDGGATFSLLLNAYDTPPGVGFYIHADHHHLSFLADGVTVLNGHDGGIHKGPFTANTSNPWADLSNTLIITQPYNIAVTQESNGDNFMMANQDNDGFSKILKNGTRQWVSALAGDGTSTAIDIANSNIRYLGGTNGQLNRANSGYADSYDAAIPVLPSLSSAAFVSPMSVHPTDANIIYACHNDIKKSTNKGGNGIADWTALNSGLTSTKSIEVVQNAGSIRIYAIGNVGQTVTAKRSDNDGASWTTITPPSGQVINSFSALPNSSTVFATVSGYNAGNKVYKSTDNGTTWTNISTGIPNIIMKKVVLNRVSTNETLYLGTELGPYFINSSATNWVKMGTGLPNVRVDDLEINYTDQTLYIGTFGRGMWKISTIVSDTTAPVADVTPLPDVVAQCSVTSLVAPTATDNEAGSVTGTTTATLPITVSTTITWSYTDGTNVSTQTQNIVISDTTAPVANTTTLATVTDQCSVANLTAPTATDNCTGSVTGTTTTTFPITTTTTVIWTYTDGTNTSTQNQQVNITDTTAPVADTANLPTITNQCSVPSLTAPTATDNCTGTVTGTTTTTFPITTTTTVVWTYTDGTNTSTQNQQVNITDNTAPVADVASLPTVTEQCSLASLTAPTATDNCTGTVTGTTTTTFPITTTTTVVWTYTDGTNTSTQNQQVNITDSTAPVANTATLPTVTEQCSLASLTAPTATDNCTGTVTGTTTTTFPITTTTTVVWTFTDGTNTSAQNQQVNITDTTAPVANVAALPTVTETCSVSTIAAPTATDNCAGSVTATTTTTFPIIASTTITWTYTDGSNASTQTQDVVIEAIDNTITQTEVTLTANVSGLMYQWIDCDNGNTPISGATNQSFTPAVSGNFAVIITNSVCEVTSQCIAFTFLGLNDNSFKNELILYPNPTEGNITLNLGSTHRGVDVTIFNILSQIVSKDHFSNTNEINLNIEGASSIYFMEIVSETGERAILRIVKE